MNNWRPFNEEHLLRLPLQVVVAILDDATVHGFEFKVENHTVYFREIE